MDRVWFGLTVGVSSWIAGFYVMYRLREPIGPDMAAEARFIDRHRKREAEQDQAANRSADGDARVD